MRTTRWVLGVAGGGLLLAASAILIATKIIDPNRYRGKVEAIVRDLTGRPFEIHGDLRLTWFPWLGVQTGAAQLGNPPGFEGPPLIEWESLQVRVKLLPLLMHREFVIDRIRVEKPRIHLRRAADGHGNWEDLAATRSPTRPEPTQPPQIAGLDLHDGTLEFGDGQPAGMRVELSGWDLTVGAWKPEQPFPATSRFVMHMASLPPTGLPIQVEAPQLTIRISPLRVAVPKLSVSAANLAAVITDVMITTDPATANTTELAASDLHSPVSGANDVHTSVSAARNIRAPASGASAVPTSVSAASHLHASGAVSAQTQSLRNLLAALGINTALPKDRTAVQIMTLNSKWEVDDGAIALKPLTLQLDETTLEGWSRRSSAAQPVWSFELHGNHIDVGRYLESDQPRTRPLELPVDALRALKAEGTLVFDEAEVRGARMKNIRLRLESQQ